MLIGTARTWHALAATLNAAANTLCPAAQLACSSAADSSAVTHGKQHAPHRRLPQDGLGLADFVAKGVPDIPSASPREGSQTVPSRQPDMTAGSSKSVFIETYVSGYFAIKLLHGGLGYALSPSGSCAKDMLSTYSSACGQYHPLVDDKHSASLIAPHVCFCRAVR